MLEKPISTKAEYRLGDDGKGNLNLLATTICPLPDKKHPFIYGFQKENYSLQDILDDSEYRWNVSDALLYIDLDANAFGTLFYKKSSQNHKWIPKWKPTLDWLFGHCYTFNPMDEEVQTVPTIAETRFMKSQIQQWKYEVSIQSTLKFTL